jgi:hypothetical protein
MWTRRRARSAARSLRPRVPAHRSRPRWRARSWRTRLLVQAEEVASELGHCTPVDPGFAETERRALDPRPETLNRGVDYLAVTSLGAFISSTTMSPSATMGSSSRKRLQFRIGTSTWHWVSFPPPNSWFGPVEKRTLP